MRKQKYNPKKQIMKKIRLLLMMFLTAAICAGFQSCSDDEEEDGGTTFSNYYVDCSSVRGGGMSSQDCETFRSSLNLELAGGGYFQVTQSEAIAEFMEDMQDLARDLSSLSADEPLITTFDLKAMGTGKCVKQATITIKKDGTTVS